MDSMDDLEKIYTENVELNPEKEKLCLKVHKKVVKTVIEAAKKTCPEFAEVYYERYDSGSYFDNLQVNCDNNDFDINIIFNINQVTGWKLTGLAADQRLPNFAFIEAGDQSSEAWASLTSENSDLQSILSPREIYKLLHRAVSRGLTSLSHQVVVDGLRYKVTRMDGAPVILNVEGSDTDTKFTVDLVPAFQLHMKHTGIDTQLRTRVEEVMASAKAGSKTFMAIALTKVSSDAFELDFHEVEKELLKSRGGCIYKVIKLIKYICKKEGGNLLKLWSHLLKVNHL